MKQIHSHSKNSLFLMEMIFVLLFLALSSAACVRIFAAAVGNHVQAVESRQAHTVSVSEIMEGGDGSTDSFIQYLCGGISDASSVSWYYDSDWNICEKQDASYQMLLELSSSRYEKAGMLSFYRMDADHALLHSTELRFPSIQSALKEEES